MGVLNLPSPALDNLFDSLKNNATIDPFNVQGMLGASGPKLEPLLRFLANKNLDRDTLLVSLRASVEVMREMERRADKCDLCWTGPPSLDVTEMSTDSVMQEIIANANEEILMAGYRITDKDETIRKLSDSMQRVNDMVIVMDDDKRHINRSTLDHAFRGTRKPRIYVHKKKEKAFYKMHAKILIADKKDLLVTSANMTHYGLVENFEMGIRVRGRSAERAHSVITKMINGEYFEELA